MPGSAWCESCPSKGAVRIDFEGPLDAPLAIVGEWPGDTEFVQRRPFVGQAGELLNAILGYVGVDRAECRLGNVLLCLQRGSKDHDVRGALSCCRRRMEDEGDLGQAKVVLALGTVAAEGLLGVRVTLGGRYPCRGAVFRDAQGRVVIPSWNPAAILRGGGSKGHGAEGVTDAEAETLGEDVRKAWDLATGKRDIWVPEVIVESDPAKFAAWCRSCGSRVAIDVETIGVDVMTADLLSVAIARRYRLEGEDRIRDEAMAFWWPNRDEEAERALRDLLGRSDVAKVFHNLQFDVSVLERHVGPVLGPLVDTMLLSHARYPECRVDLASVAQTWLATKPWKHEYHAWDDDMRRRLERLSGNRDQASLPFAEAEVDSWPEERCRRLLEYNAWDAAATAAIEPVLVDRCTEEGVEVAAAVDIALARVARKMTEHGVYVSLEVRDQLRRETEDRMREAEAALKRIVDQGLANPVDPKAAEELREEIVRRGWNPDSRKMLLLAFDVCGVKVPAEGLTAKGDRSLSKRSLASIGDEPLVMALMDVRRARRQYSVYFADGALPLGSDGRMHIPWKIHGTPTGRWSSGYDEDLVSSAGSEEVVSLALMNWPAAMRRMVVAPPGYVLVGADMAQLEYRVIALLAGEDSLLDLFNDPGRPDLHSVNAARLYGATWEMTDPDKARDPQEKDRRKRQRKVLRGLTKNGLYGALYGASAETVRETLRARSLTEPDPEMARALRMIDLKKCQEFVDAIPRLWPAIAAWRTRQIREASETGEIRMPISGRVRRWPLCMVDAQQAVNTPVQGTAGDLVNWRFLELARVLPAEAKIILQVHDSVVIECPESMGEEVKEIVTKTLTTTWSYGGRSCIFPAEAAVGKSWDVV